MAATVRGALAVEVASSELAAARRAVGRAVASGAIGPGRTVSLDGEGVIFEGGRIDLHADGRATYELAVGVAERVRVAQAAGVAALVSAVTTLMWSWNAYVALGAGGATGLVWAVALIAGDRRRLRRQVRALLRSLPLLV